MGEYELNYVISYLIVSLVYMVGLYLVITWPGGFEKIKDKVREIAIRCNDWLEGD